MLFKNQIMKQIISFLPVCNYMVESLTAQEEQFKMRNNITAEIDTYMIRVIIARRNLTDDYSSLFSFLCRDQ